MKAGDGSSQVPKNPVETSQAESLIEQDVETLHSLGYAQELLRRMSGFSNFAVSFSIILWFGYEQRRFQGPPQGVMIQQRQAKIEEAEKAIGESH